ncbi:uncharacterized protein LAJ45_11250 [Morchella importuna]|uniref:uncharacterized protein n=1 Tax=Morchella importuna TaxID=1174673 RepID=UPI001E8E98E1|nr:uncharacterized protein LAJ45_11250 [Morchella importuna]KAH8144749.1 hypothetical protein LAJ45_11250 [Morchella importuna]
MALGKLRKAARVILVGPPGCGKGTQSGRLLDHFKLSSISSGDLLRQNVRAKTPLGVQAESIMKSGGLVHDSIMVKLIVGELSKRGWVETRGNMASASFLLDGFPRTQSQAKSLDEEVQMNLVVNLDVPHDVILERIAGRLVHEPSGRVYNTTWNKPMNPGVDDITGEPLTRRSDDQPETFAKRLKAYAEATEPLLEHYDKAGVLWTVRGKTSDEITPQLDAEIQRRFA